jgi:hypothetical protein
MILTNRLFERVPPSRDARSIYIFCEGAKRERHYFRYFKELDSRINIEVYELHPHEDNSPLGLLEIAKKCIIKSKDNPNPKYSFLENDEVWIVLDTDKDKTESRQPQIETVKQECAKRDAWFIAQSNPCFEVWLYYHTLTENPNFEGSGTCTKWKQLVNNLINGGFDSSRHPIFIKNAITAAEKNFHSITGNPGIGSTEVYNLANSIYPLVESKINKVLDDIER